MLFYPSLRATLSRDQSRHRGEKTGPRHSAPTLSTRLRGWSQDSKPGQSHRGSPTRAPSAELRTVRGGQGKGSGGCWSQQGRPQAGDTGLLFTSPQPGPGVLEGQPTLRLGVVPNSPSRPRAGHTHWRALLTSHCRSGIQDNLPAGDREGWKVLSPGKAKLSSGPEAGPEGRVDRTRSLRP